MGPPQNESEIPTANLANNGSLTLHIWGRPPSTSIWLNSFSLNVVSTNPSVASFATNSVVVHNPEVSNVQRFEKVNDSTMHSSFPMTTDFPLDGNGEAYGLRLRHMKGYTTLADNLGVGGTDCRGDNTFCKQPVGSNPSYLLASFTINGIGTAGTTQLYLQLGDIGILQASYIQNTYTTGTTLNTSAVFGAADGPSHNGYNDREADVPFSNDTADLIVQIGGTPQGDFNSNGKVDSADYIVWRNGLGSTYSQTDYTNWRSNFGDTSGSGAGAGSEAIPEPAAILFALCSFLFAVLSRTTFAWRDQRQSGSYSSRAAAFRLVATSLAAAAIICCLPTCASAVDRFWTNPAGGSFSTGANWTGGQAPGSGDQALFNLPNTYTVVFPANVTVGGQQTTAGQVTLDLQNHIYDVNGYSEVNLGGTVLHVMGDYKQSSNTLAVANGAHLDIDGKFNFNGHSVAVFAGGIVSIDNPQQSSINTTGIYLSQGAQLNVGSVVAASSTVPADVVIGLPGSKLRSYGDITQTGGRFLIDFFGQLQADGKYNFSGTNFQVASGASVISTNTAQSSIETSGTFNVFDHVQVTAGSITSASHMLMSNNALVQATDVTQTNGNFTVELASQLQASGKLNLSGQNFRVSSGGRVAVGNQALSSINMSGTMSVQNGAQIGVNSVGVGSDFLVSDTNSKLQTLGDYAQTGGTFRVINDGQLQVGGKLNFTGGSVQVISGGTVSITNTQQSSINTTGIYVNNGGQLHVGTIVSAADVVVGQLNTKLRSDGDMTQASGQFLTDFGASVEAGGKFNFTGTTFQVASGASVMTGNTAQSSVQTSGTFRVFDNSQATVGSVTAGSDILVSNNAVVHAANVTQIGGEVTVELNSDLEVNGDFTQTGNITNSDHTLNVVHGGHLDVVGKLNFTGWSMSVFAGGTVSIGNPQQSSINATGIYVSNGAEIQVGTINAASDVVVGQLGSKLRSHGDMIQTGGRFLTDFGAQVEADEKFNFTGTSFQVASGANLTVGNTAQSSIQTTGVFNVFDNSQATVGSILAGSDMLISNNGVVNATSVTQTSGKFTVELNSDLQVGGLLDLANSSIRISNGGSVVSNSALYRNTTRSAIEGGIFAGSDWNVSTNLRIEGANHIAGTTTLNARDTAQLSVGNTLTIGSGGRLSGNATIASPQFVVENDGQVSGSVTLQGSVSNAGQVAPGLPSGILTVAGTYTQQSDGSLQIEVGGTTLGSTYDKLHVTGVANLSGRLDVPLINGFVPQSGNTINYLHASSIMGGFDSLSSPNLATAGNGLGIEMSPNTATELNFKFVPVSNSSFGGTAASSNWMDASIWSMNTVPKSSSIVTMQNNTAAAQQVDVTQNTFVHNLAITGGANPLTLAIQSGKSFSSLTGVTVSNQGIIHVDSGRLVTNTLNVFTGGQLNVLNGGRFLTSSNATTPVTISTTSGAGTASVLVAGAGSEFRTDGTLAIGSTGNGTLTVQNQGAVRSINGQVGISAGSNGNVSLSGSNSKWTVGGSLYIGGSSTAAGGTGQVALTSGARLAVGDRLHLWDSGSLSIDSNSIASVGVGTPTNTPGSLQVLSGGILSGRGTVTGKVINSGRLQPGASPGITVITGDYTQTSDGSLEIEIGGLTPGTQHDQVQVSGTASLDGSIEFPIVDGFVPQIGMGPVTFMTAGSITGAPKTLVSPNLKDVSPNVGFRVVKSSNSLDLFFVAPTDVNFVDATATEVAPADWAQASSWSGGIVPGTDTRITVGNNSVTLDPQRIDVKSLDPVTAQPVAYADQLTVTDPLGQITVGVETGYRLQASTGSVTISKNGAVELAPGGVLATPQMVQLTSGGTLRGDGTIVADDLIVSDGTVSPGITVGELAVEGNYRLGAKSKLMIDVEGKLDGQHDTVNVADELELGGNITFTISPTSTIAVGDIFPVISSESITAASDFKSIATRGSNDLRISVFETFDGGVMAEVGASGDMNGDGRVLDHDEVEGEVTYYSDIPFFAMALSDLEKYKAYELPSGAKLGNRWARGDLGTGSDDDFFSGDGITLDDIKGFAKLFDMPEIEMRARLQGVPEPSCVAFAATTIAALLLGCRRRASCALTRTNSL